MSRFWRQWLLTASIIVYAVVCIVMVASVNHNMTEALEVGAFAHIKVEGKRDNNLMTQVKAPGPPIMSAQRSAGQ